MYIPIYIYIYSRYTYNLYYIYPTYEGLMTSKKLCAPSLIADIMTSNIKKIPINTYPIIPSNTHDNT